MVLGVRLGSPADRAGIRPFDPRLGAVGDDDVAVFEDAGVGKEVTLRVVRGDAEREVRGHLIDVGA